MEAPEHGEGCPEAVGLHGKAAAEALQSGAERVRRELQAGRGGTGVEGRVGKETWMLKWQCI